MLLIERAGWHLIFNKTYAAPAELQHDPGVRLFDLHCSLRQDSAQIKAWFVPAGGKSNGFEPQCAQRSHDLRNSVGLPPGLESTRARRDLKSGGRNANCSMSDPAYLSLTKYS